VQSYPLPVATATTAILSYPLPAASQPSAVPGPYPEPVLKSTLASAAPYLLLLAVLAALFLGIVVISRRQK
jgi:hypothetical protein